MRVFLLWQNDAERYLFGVFATKEAAIAARDKMLAEQTGYEHLKDIDEEWFEQEDDFVITEEIVRD